MPPIHNDSNIHWIKEVQEDEERQPLSAAHDRDKLTDPPEYDDGVEIKQSRHPKNQSGIVGFLRKRVFISSVVLAAFVAGVQTGKLDITKTEQKMDQHKQKKNHKQKLDMELTPEKDPEKYERFIIFAQQRSGSGFLKTLMRNHTMILCGSEELYNKPIPENDIESYMKMVTGTFTDLLGKNNKHLDDTVTHVGYKIMYDQGVLEYNKEMLVRLNKLGIKVIHLIRQNKLQQYISSAANHEDHASNPESHTAHPTNKKEINTLSEIQVEGSPKKVMKFLDRKYGEVEDVTNALETYLEPSMMDTVIYEDLSNDNDKEMGNLFQFLGVSVQKVTTDLLKIHEDKKLRQYFKETDQIELKKALKKSKYSWMLENW